MKSAKLTLLLLGIILITVTTLLYAWMFDEILNNTIKWLTLVIILLSESTVIIKMLALKSELISKTSIIINVVHLIVVLFVFVVFICFFEELTKTYIILNVLFALILFAVDLCILYFGKNANISDKKLKQSQNVLDTCFVKAQMIAKNYENTVYGKDLTNIAEQIKYSDNTELTGEEMSILNKLGELETELISEGDNVSRIISEAKNLISLRSIKMQNLKKGGY